MKQNEMQENSFVIPPFPAPSCEGEYLFSLLFLGSLDKKAFISFLFHERWELIFWETNFEMTCRCSNLKQEKKNTKAKLWIGIL